MSTAPPAKIVIIVCSQCGKERKTRATPTGVPRTPPGWKHHDLYYCDECWRQKYVLRAITLPVAEPLSLSWEELRKILKVQWAQTTAAANRIMTECYARDVRRKPGDEKIPPMPKVYLYNELRAEFPDLPSQTVASLEQACQRKYRALRYQIVWTAGAALPTYRYPTPLPIPAQRWIGWISQDKLMFRVKIGEDQVELRLKGGAQFRRQHGQFQTLARGEAVPGEAAIYQRGPTLLVKMVAWLPRPAAQTAAGGMLRVRTTRDSLLVAVNSKDESLWTYNGDHLRRWAAEHRKRLQRWSEDAKYESRPVPGFAARRQAAAVKFRDRMNSATHEISAQLVGYALRRHYAGIEYDDTERGFCAQLPWFRLRTLIAQKAQERSIEFVVKGPAEEPAEEEKKIMEQTG
jgi:hypothetical protein